MLDVNCLFYWYAGINFTEIPIHVENFNTAIYWRPHAVCPIELSKYNILFKANNEEWRKSNCTIRENKTTNELSCLFLRCETTKDSSYVVNVVNPFGPKNSFYFFRPSLESKTKFFYRIVKVTMRF